MFCTSSADKNINRVNPFFHDYFYIFPNAVETLCFGLLLKAITIKVFW